MYVVTSVSIFIAPNAIQSYITYKFSIDVLFLIPYHIVMSILFHSLEIDLLACQSTDSTSSIH